MKYVSERMQCLDKILNLIQLNFEYYVPEYIIHQKIGNPTTG